MPERLASPKPFLGPAPRAHRRLRILCLHGFRQTGGKLRGHWAGLTRRLGDLADFTFVDAPHALPLYYRGERPPAALPASVCKALPGAPCPRCTAPGAQPAPCWGVPAGSMSRGRGREVAAGNESSSGRQCKRLSSCRGPDSACACQATDSGGAPPRPKRAWLVEAAAEGMARDDENQGAGPRDLQWQPAPAALDAQQHLRQVEGWAASLAMLRQMLRSSDGPFDGVMGFSQVGDASITKCTFRKAMPVSLTSACMRGAHACKAPYA